MTRTVPRTARLLTAAAALALAGGALTGCSARPGQAYVGSYTGLDGATRSVRVSEEDVQTASSQLSAIDGVTSDTVFSALVVLQPYDELAGRYGITVTDDDARSTLETQLGPGDYSRPTINAVRSILIQQGFSALDQDTLAQLGSDASAIKDSTTGDASPRYTLTRERWLVHGGSSSSPTMAPG